MAHPLWAVRRDWPTGDHEYVTPRDCPAAVGRALRSDRAFWQRSPLRPTLSMVCISPHDFDLHARARRGCRAPDCPAAGDIGPPASGDIGPPAARAA